MMSDEQVHAFHEMFAESLKKQDTADERFNERMERYVDRLRLIRSLLNDALNPYDGPDTVCPHCKEVIP